MYQVNKVEIPANIPQAFDGLKIVQISDLHLGSYGNNRKPLSEAIRIINELNPDMIVFTGDIVNNYALETIPFIDVFKQLNKPPLGMFAVLGNHDFSDYSSWSDENKKQKNSALIEEFLKSSGFQVLRNKYQFVFIEKDSLCIAGVDNWGIPPFKKYGNLPNAMTDIDESSPVILLSHNPTHWRGEVLDYKNIFLTLSGHTHGMQMGIETSFFTWSPVKYMYKEWQGLYTSNDQYLYVNKGLGFIGFSARIGMYPEITLITLKKRSLN
jgi:hypothetical protein